MLTGAKTISLIDRFIAKLYQLTPGQDNFNTVAASLDAIERAGLSWVNAKSLFGHTIAHICAFKGLHNILSALIARCFGREQLDLNSIHPNEDYSPLHFACAKGFVEVARVILQHDKRGINAKDVFGMTPLHLAYSILGNSPNKQALIDLLIANGASQELKNHAHQKPHEMRTRGYFKAPFMMNCFCQFPTHYVHRKEMREMLNDKDKTLVALWVNSVDDAGRTPLMAMAINNSLEGVNFLLGRGADVTQVDHDSRSALFYGAFFSSVEILRRLLESGASLIQPALGGITPLMVAEKYGRQEVVDLFRQHLSAIEYFSFRQSILDIQTQTRASTLETSLQALTINPPSSVTP